jgi:hypothetical protein
VTAQSISVDSHWLHDSDAYEDKDSIYVDVYVISR